MEHDLDEMTWRQAAVESVVRQRSAHLPRLSTELVALDRIGGRVLAEPIDASRDIPAADHATMDGFAFDATDEYPLELVESEVFPEDDPPELGSGRAVRIATGAPLPRDANAVLKREDAHVSDGKLSGPSIPVGTYTYRRGTNVSAGERLFAKGASLSAKDAILLGDIDRETVPVYEPFSVGVLATGTEIHEGRQHDLDSHMLCNLVRSWGHEATYEGTVPDEFDRVEAAIDRLAGAYDVVLTTGGTSVGHKDHVITALAELGTIHFHRVRIRPGKPIAMATIGSDTTAFAIPGKPVGAHLIAVLVMRPFFTGDTALPTVHASFSTDLEMGPSGFEYVVPVDLVEGEARPLGHVSSPVEIYEARFDPSVLSSTTRATRADGFVVTREKLAAGETVDIVPYPVVE